MTGRRARFLSAIARQIESKRLRISYLSFISTLFSCKESKKRVTMSKSASKVRAAKRKKIRIEKKKIKERKLEGLFNQKPRCFRNGTFPFSFFNRDQDVTNSHG